MIQLTGLEKSYGSFARSSPSILKCGPARFLVFSAPNGAGKTTTLRMLMGILVPSAGHAKIAGFDCQHEAVEVKKRVGYLPDQPVFYDYLRGREILSFVAEMHGMIARPPATARKKS